MWCPMGRVSVQHFEGPNVKALAAGAFNIVNLAQSPGGPAPTYLASTCQGRHCPLYRRGFNPWGWGRCALAQPADGPWILASMVCIAIIAAATVIFLVR